MGVGHEQPKGPIGLVEGRHLAGWRSVLAAGWASFICGGAALVSRGGDPSLSSG